MSNGLNDFANSIDDLKDLLSAYIDDELTPDERQMVEEGLVAFPELKAELTSLTRTVDIVQNLPRVPAPAPFTLTEFDVGIATSPTKGANSGSVYQVLWQNFWLKTGLGAVAALLVVVFLGIFFSQQNLRSQPESVAMSVAQVQPTEPALANKAASDAADEEPRAQTEPVQSSLADESSVDVASQAIEVVESALVDSDQEQGQIEADVPEADTQAIELAVLPEPGTTNTPASIPTPTPQPQATSALLPPSPLAAPEGQQRSTFAESAAGTDPSSSAAGPVSEPPPAPILSDANGFMMATTVYTIEALTIVFANDYTDVQAQLTTPLDAYVDLDLRLATEGKCIVSSLISESLGETRLNGISSDDIADSPPPVVTINFIGRVDQVLTSGTWYATIVRSTRSDDQPDCISDVQVLTDEVTLIIEDNSVRQLDWKRAN